MVFSPLASLETNSSIIIDIQLKGTSAWINNIDENKSLSNDWNAPDFYSELEHVENWLEKTDLTLLEFFSLLMK